MAAATKTLAHFAKKYYKALSFCSFLGDCISLSAGNDGICLLGTEDSGG